MSGMIRRIMKKTDHTGSLTIEAALILPLFLSGMLLVAGLIQILMIHFVVGAALQNVGEKIALYTGAGEIIAGEAEYTEELSQCENILSLTYAEGVIRSELSKKTLVKEAVLETGYLSLLRSQIMQDGQTIDLVADYRICLPFSGLFMARADFTQRARVHGWVGYQLPSGEVEENEETMVYITPHGSVYHRSADCTYLKPKVSAVSADALSTRRSRDGEIYYPCELCDPPAQPSSEAVLYITSYGNRYHADSDCRGISHEIEEVPLSEVGGRRPCSKCGIQ